MRATQSFKSHQSLMIPRRKALCSKSYIKSEMSKCANITTQYAHLVPVLQAFRFGDLLIIGMAVEYVVISGAKIMIMRMHIKSEYKIIARDI